MRVHEELLPEGIATGALRNEDIWNAFDRWHVSVSKDIRSFHPNGVFIGLGFDLHKSEKRIADKKAGVGITGQHYFKLLRSLPASVLKGPFVLTLEGGYTHAAIVDGIHGALSGLEALSAGRTLGNSIQRAFTKKMKRTPASAKSKCRRIKENTASLVKQRKSSLPQSAFPHIELEVD